MTGQEINMQLALAIGHKSGWVNTHGTDSVWVFTGTTNRQFDYRDPAVIWPIAERFDAFPSKSQGLSPGWWPRGVVRGKCMSHIGICDTAAKAVALAVIEGMKK
jgi:hypothetical protein